MGTVFAQTQTESLFGVPSPEIIINKTEFFPGEKIEITIQQMPQIPPNTDPRLELYLYLPFLQKIGKNVPLNCLGENCIVVYSFDEIRKGETDPKTISLVLFSEKNPKPIVESGWLNSVCDLKFNDKTIERYGNTCNSLDVPPGIYKIKFGWGIEISDKFEIIKTIPITVKEYSSVQNSETQIFEKLPENILDKESNTKIIGDVDSENKQIVNNNTKIEVKESESVQETQETTSNGGGCLIATATYGSEISPQVQQLRELRDNSLLKTKLGTSFINTFNIFYYSFSPIIADYERENPLFKETVQLIITPMISSLSLLNYVDMDSESKVLGYGISLIVLNLAMYVGIPTSVIIGIKRKLN